MTFAAYGPRINVHPDRYGATRSLSQIEILVVHDSEQSGESTTSAEALGNFMTTRGDRLNNDGSRYGASYHAVTDTDRVLPATQDNIVAYAAGGGNVQGLHVCIPGKAAQTPAQWADTISAQFVEQCARWLADQCQRYNIPPRKMTVAQVRAGEKGICAHGDVSLAFGKSDHTDPGPNFPWTKVINRVQTLLAPDPPNPWIVAVEPWGTFELHEEVRWPVDVAEAVYGRSELWPWIVNFNAPTFSMEDWEQKWPPIGGKVKVPPLKAQTGEDLAGVRVKVPPNTGAAAVIGIAFPGTWAQRAARLPEFVKWNGGDAQVKPGEIVFVRA